MLEMIQTADASALLWIQEFIRADWFNPVVTFFTRLGNAGIGWIVLTALLLCIPKTRKYGFASAIALIFSLFVTNLGLKPLFSRTRPYYVVEGLVPLVTSSDLNSFPSGHTSTAFAAGIAWAMTADRTSVKVIAVLQAILMALSRLYVGVHYPSDVLVGMIAGCFCGFMAVQAVKLIKKRKSIQRN